MHLGKSFAGPELLRQMVDASANLGSHHVFVAYNPAANLSFSSKVLGTLPIKTYASKLSFLGNMYKVPFIGFKLRRFIKQNRIDVVVTSMLNFYQDLSIPIWKTSTVAYWPIIHDAKIHLGDESIIQTFTTKLEIRHASKIVTLSEKVREELEKGNKKPIQVLWHPPLFRLKQDGISVEGIQKLVFFGRLQPYKGINMLLEAAAKCREEGLIFDLHIYGSGPEAHLADTQVGSQATWHVGYLSNDEVENCIANSHWVLLPYQEASQSGVVSLCVSARVPMISTNVDGLVQQLADSGGAIVAGGRNANDFAAAMKTALVDSQIRDEVIASFSNQATKDWTSFSKQLFQDWS